MEGAWNARHINIKINVLTWRFPGEGSWENVEYNAESKIVSNWSPTAKNDMCMNTCWTWYIKSNEPDWNIILQILDHQDTPKMDRRSPGCTLTMQKTQISYARLCMLKIVPESFFSWIPSWGLEVIPKWTQNRAKKAPKSSQKSSQNRSEGVWTIWTLQKWSSWAQNEGGPTV